MTLGSGGSPMFLLVVHQPASPSIWPAVQSLRRLCKCDLRKGDLFVLSWARVRRGRPGCLSSELLMCGGGVRSILLLPLVARCLET